MEKWHVSISWTVSTSVNVEAETEEEARQKAATHASTIMNNLECPAVERFTYYCNGEQLEPYYIGEVVKDE